MTTAPKLATISNGQLTDARPVSPIVALDERFLPIKGTAVAASKLATVRKIAGVAFDGTKDIALTPENVGALPSGGTAAASIRLATSRKIAGVAFDGTANIDLPGVNTTGHQATTGNAATATTLQTPRKINGVPFDGSADIGVNTLVSRGRVPALSGNNQGTSGIQLYEAYGNGYPTPYGNVIHLKGASAGGEGELLVGWSGVNGAHSPVYIRSRRDFGDAPWSAWAQVFTANDIQAYTETELDRRYQPKGAGQSYTKAESDARYVRDVQRGTVSAIYTPEGVSTDAPKGCVMVGVTLSGDGSTGTHVHQVRYCPLQIKINGAWRTISDIADSK